LLAQKTGQRYATLTRSAIESYTACRRIVPLYQVIVLGFELMKFFDLGLLIQFGLVLNHLFRNLELLRLLEVSYREKHTITKRAKHR
jgi:hypothetical protein